MARRRNLQPFAATLNQKKMTSVERLYLSALEVGRFSDSASVVCLSVCVSTLLSQYLGARLMPFVTRPQEIIAWSMAAAISDQALS